MLGATSSAVRRGDFALVWRGSSADLVKIDGDYAVDPGLTTAVLLSLFTDRAAEPDDVPPSGDPTDRRGWWADEFAAVPGDKLGSRLWLLDRAKRTGETLRRAEEYSREALAWMLEDRVASAVDITVEFVGDAMVISVVIQRPGRDPVSLKFAHVWGGN